MGKNQTVTTESLERIDFSVSSQKASYCKPSSRKTSVYDDYSNFIKIKNTLKGINIINAKFDQVVLCVTSDIVNNEVRHFMTYFFTFRFIRFIS